SSGPVGDVVNLLSHPVVMFLGAASRLQPGFSQTLVANAGIAMCQQFSNFRSILGREWRHIIQVLNLHSCFFPKIRFILFLLSAVIGIMVADFTEERSCQILGSGPWWRVIFLPCMYTLTGGAKVINVTSNDSSSKIKGAVVGAEVVIAGGTYAFRLYLTRQAS